MSDQLTYQNCHICNAIERVMPCYVCDEACCHGCGEVDAELVGEDWQSTIICCDCRDKEHSATRRRTDPVFAASQYTQDLRDAVAAVVTRYALSNTEAGDLERHIERLDDDAKGVFLDSPIQFGGDLLRDIEDSRL